MARDGWGVDDVRERCRDYREVLADAPECCTAEELAAYWPGGKENPYPGRGGWLYCYGTYRAFLWKLKDTSPLQDRVQVLAEQSARDAAWAQFRSVIKNCKAPTEVLDTANTTSEAKGE